LILDGSASYVRALNRSAICALLVVQVTLFLRDQLSVENSWGYWFQMSIPFSLGIFSVCMGLILKIGESDSKNSKSSLLVEPILPIVLILTIGIAIYVKRPLESFGSELWNGFGLPVFILTLFTSGLMLLFSHKVHRNVFRGICLGILILDFPTFLQPPGGIININDATYHVLDEFLAPFNGFFPDSTYTPSYTAMFGWLIWPVRFFHPSSQFVMLLVIVLANVFLIGIPILVAAAIKQLDKRNSFLLVLTATSSFIVVSGETNGASTVLSSFSTFGRFLPPLFGLFLLSKSATTRNEFRQKIWFVSSGAVASITFFNNADFGLSYVIASFLGLSVIAIFYKRTRGILLCYVFGFVAFAATYLAILYVFADGFSLKMYITLVLLGQSGDIYFFKMDHLGPHLIIFMIVSSLLTLTILSLRQARRDLDHANSLATEITSVVASLWTLALLLMFSVRPIVPFGAQQLLIPTSLNLFLIYTYLRKDEFKNQFPNAGRKYVQAFPFLLILVLPFSSSIQLPNPVDEIKRVTGHARYFKWSSSDLRPPADGWTDVILSAQGTLHYPDQWLNAIKNYANDHASEMQDTAYFGYMGNTVQLITGIENVTGLAAPEHLRFGIKFENWACAPIIRKKPMKIISYGTKVPCVGLTLLGNDASGLLQIYEVNP